MWNWGVMYIKNSFQNWVGSYIKNSFKNWVGVFMFSSDNLRKIVKLLGLLDSNSNNLT